MSRFAHLNTSIADSTDLSHQRKNDRQDRGSKQKGRDAMNDHNTTNRRIFNAAVGHRVSQAYGVGHVEKIAEARF